MREHAARMRAAERQAELDAWQLREDEREKGPAGRVRRRAVARASTRGRKLRWTCWWSTCTSAERSSERSTEARIVEMYEAVRNKRNARKAAAAGGGGGGGGR